MATPTPTAAATPAQPAPLKTGDIIDLADFNAKPLNIIRRANTSLNLGGSVDIITTREKVIFAVVRFAKITPEVTKEVSAILQKEIAMAGVAMPSAPAPAETPAPAPTPAAQPAPAPAQPK
jgi:hypothetical protein